MLTRNKTFQMLRGTILGLVVVIFMPVVDSQAQTDKSEHKGAIYSNPRVYNIEYSLELFPDPAKNSHERDLKLWIPVPRESQIQRPIKILSVEPAPQGRYVDPEYGNRMLFWDFGEESNKSSYKVSLKYRVERYDVHSNIDPNRIGPYSKTSKDYVFNTRSTNTVTITDEVRELARTAVGDERNPYLQAKRIYEFVRERMCYRIPPGIQPTMRDVKSILDESMFNPRTGQEYYWGQCTDRSMLFVALCRAVGIPARTVLGLWNNRPWIWATSEHLQPAAGLRRQLIQGLAVRSRMPMGAHEWAEVHLPNYGWVLVDPTFGHVGHLNVNNKVIAITKGRDVQIDPHAVQKENGGYREIGGPLCDGRARLLLGGVFHAATIQSVEYELVHHPDPFPADALAEYTAIIHRDAEAKDYLALYRKRALRWIDENTREHEDKIEALAKAYEETPQARYEHEVLICHMLRKIVGDRKFFDIVQTYTGLRVRSGQPVSTAHFQKIAEDVYSQPLGWFFEQWVKYTELPQLQLGTVRFLEDKEGWHVRGSLRQLNKSLFRLPVELVVETERTRKSTILWLADRNAEFEFGTADRPKTVLIDPNNNILCIREMPPLLEDALYDEVAFCAITDLQKADWHDWTPLHFAAQAGRINVVEYLVAHGANVNARNIEGETPLEVAGDKDHEEVIAFLIEKGADFSLHSVVRLGDLAKVKSFVENGADIDVEDLVGETPLHVAAAKDHKEIAEFLIARGAKVDPARPGYTPLHSAAGSGFKDIVELLIANGANVNAQKRNGNTPLHEAAREGYVDIVEVLLAKGAEVHAKGRRGRTALTLATKRDHTEVVELLKKHGAKE